MDQQTSAGTAGTPFDRVFAGYKAARAAEQHTGEPRGERSAQSGSSPPYRITVARTNGPVATKTWLADGSVKGYDPARLFTYATRTVANIAELSALLTRIENDPHAFIIRGTLKGDAAEIQRENLTAWNEDARQAATKAGKSFHPITPGDGQYLRRSALVDDHARHWLMVDIDGADVGVDPITRPAEAIKKFIREHLPAEFHEASFHWQLSSSTGHANKQGLNAHVWFWLREPAASGQLRQWATENKLPIDASIYSGTQVHYTAAPVFENGVTDPVRARSGFVEGANADVLLALPEPRVYEPSAYAGPQQYEKVRSALMAIDPNTLDYHGWLRMLFSVHASTEASDEGLALIHEWSQQYPGYTEAETDKQWRHAKIKPGGIGWGTLRHAALAAGWSDPDTDASGFDVFAAAPPVDVGAVANRLGGLCLAYDTLDDGVDPQLEADIGRMADEARAQTIKIIDEKISPEAAAEIRALFERLAKGQVRRGRFTAIPAGEFAKRPRTGWRIKGVLPATGVAMIFGQPGSGKSFLALDICAAIARGEPWRVRKVTKGRVLYVAAEAQGGISARLGAYLHSNALAEVPGLWVVGETPNFHSGDADDRAISGLAKQVGADVVVIDTLAAATAGADENTAKDMNAVMGRLNAIREATGGLVVLVHHSGKDESKGARGWSGMKGAVDTEVEVTRPDEEQPARVARVTKQKEGESGQAFGFELAVVELGVDQDGDPVTSCVVRAIDEVPMKRGKKRDLPIAERRPRSQYQQVAYDRVAEAGGPVHLDELLDVIAARMPEPEDGKRDRRRSNARREIEKLIAGDFLEVAPGGCLRLRGTGAGL